MDTTKKKIIFFIPTFPVVSETFIEREVQELLNRNNFDLKILTLKKSSEFNYKDLEDKVTYINLSLTEIISGFFYFASNNFSGLISTLFTVLSNKQKSLGDNLYLWVKSIGYGYIFSKYSAEQIHVHFFSEPSTIGYIASILLKTKYSLSGHAKDVFDTEQLPDLFSKKLEKCTFAVVCNKKAYDFCVKSTTLQNSKKIHLEYHGVDFKEAEKYKQYENIQKKVPVLYFIGRFVPKKGIIYLLDAIRILSLKNARLQLIIAGFGEEYDTYVDFINKNKLEEMVTFANEGTGVSNDKSLELMAESDIVVAPSIDLESGDSDGIPNALLEAGMLAKPVITTDAGSIEELVLNNQTGLVVEQKNSLQISEAILKLINDKELSEKLGNNLYQSVFQKFNIDQNITNLEKLLAL